MPIIHGYVVCLFVGLLCVYNRGMAKGMQCLQAIPDCTREVKAEYHNVIGLYHRKLVVFDYNNFLNNRCACAAPSGLSKQLVR